MAWRTRFEKELNQAEAARQAGNEGMARVCARRAVGILAEEYLARRNLRIRGKSAYDRLRDLEAESSLTEHTRSVVRHFLLRITPEHELPEKADLIGEARWLAENLLV